MLNCWIEWGENSLKKLIGMFAFALFDSSTEELLLVRDGFGIKPLFYYLDDKFISFASEIDPLQRLVSCIPSVNIQRSYEYLNSSALDFGSRTFLRDINQIPPGHFLKINLNSLKNFELKKWLNINIKIKSKLNFSRSCKKFKRIIFKKCQVTFVF